MCALYVSYANICVYMHVCVYKITVGYIIMKPEREKCFALSGEFFAIQEVKSRTS